MATNAMSAVNAILNPDDNLSNGQWYTFVFKCTNLFGNSSANALANDISTNAPDFLTALNVTAEQGSANAGYYNVVFQYSGDGSDVVSDVATAVVNAAATGSNDDFTYVVGFGASIPTYSVTSGGNSGGVTYSFDPLNVLEPVTPSQSAAYSAEATAQVQAVGMSPGGQVATAVAPSTPSGQNSFTQTVQTQSNAAASNVSQISTAANQAAAAANNTVLLIVGGVLAAIAAFFLLAKPKVSVGA
jgi:hypothetical protein